MTRRILAYSRAGADHPPEPLAAEEWRRWAARVFAEAVAEQGTPILDGVPKSRAKAEAAGSLELWELCRRGFLRARGRVKRCALVLAHTAMQRALSGDDDLWGLLAEQYRGIYLRTPGDDPADDDEALGKVSAYLAASEECAARSLRREAEDDL